MGAGNGFLDLQVNGYVGVDFNGDSLALDRLREACRRLQEEGVDGILATVITDRVDAMCRRLARIVELRAADPLVKDMIRGIHIEGPFLNENPGYIGAHPIAAARPAEPDAMQQLLDAAGGLARIVTLAPERDRRLRVVRMLVGQGVVVSAGHCDASFDQLHAAVDAGLSMFTHLGNGCPLMLHRHDNIIQRALALSGQLWIGLIADGVHVPYATLGNMIRCAGLDRCFVVTDAVSAAGLGPGRFSFGDQEVVVDENLATWSADRSHLMGSAVTMSRVVANLREHLGFSAADVRRLTVDNPRQAAARNV